MSAPMHDCTALHWNGFCTCTCMLNVDKKKSKIQTSWVELGDQLPSTHPPQYWYAVKLCKRIRDGVNNTYDAKVVFFCQFYLISDIWYERSEWYDAKVFVFRPTASGRPGEEKKWGLALGSERPFLPFWSSSSVSQNHHRMDVNFKI